ncbi:MAG: hypothetical protein WCT18_03015 [Patescibacteria group bacterium]
MIDKNSKKKKEIWWQPAVELLAQVSAWIIGPILGALFLGGFIEKRMHNEPWPTVILVAIAFVITNIGLIKQTLKASKKIEAEIKKDKEDKQ